MCFFVYFAKPHAYKKQHPMHLHTRRNIVVPRSTKLAWTSLVWFFWEGSCTSLPQEDVCAACVFQGHGHLYMYSLHCALREQGVRALTEDKRIALTRAQGAPVVDPGMVCSAVF